MLPRRIFTKIRTSGLIKKSIFPARSSVNSQRCISSTHAMLKEGGVSPVKTFATENPELVEQPKPGKLSNEEKVYFDDFEPGEPIEMIPLPPFDDGSGKVLASPELHKLADRILNLNLLEVHQLTLLFNDHFNFGGNDLSQLVGGGGGGGGGGESQVVEEVVEEKTVFDIKLTGFDKKAKIKIIKEVRSATELGLKEAKEMVEGAPKIIKKDMKKEDAEAFKEKLEALGATVEIV